MVLLEGTCLPDHATGNAKDGIRTRDPDLGKVVLYQLSYFRFYPSDKRNTKLKKPFDFAMAIVKKMDEGRRS